MWSVDAHLDLAWNALQWNRDLRQRVYTLRAQEARMEGAGRGSNTVSLPELRRGRVALCFGTVIARAGDMFDPRASGPAIDYGSPEQAYAAAQGHIAYYEALERTGEARRIESAGALEAHIAEWQAWDAGTAGGADEDEEDAPPPTGIVIAMECADPIVFPEQVPEWFERGLRVIGPAHYGHGRYVGGTGTEEGFNEEGIELLRAMSGSGMILDVTHLSDEALAEALDLYDGPLIASHHNCRALVPHQRQLSDGQIRALAARGAVIGAAFDAWMLVPGWNLAHESGHAPTLATVAEHMDRVCQLTGSAAHAGIGSDLDGGFGRESAPSDLDTIADVGRLADALADLDYTDEEISDMMHGNWIRLLQRAWKRMGNTE